MKIALKIAYLGDRYYGFQRQPGLRTVESVMRDALLRIGVANGDFCYAGRTDRGVSALGQVIDFWIEEDRAYLAFPRVINSLLPSDVWAWARAVAPVGFSARWSALWREYRYFLFSPDIDLSAVREAAGHLVGTHDFRNFSMSKVDTVRRIISIDVNAHCGIVVFDVRAEGFIWNMVRRIVGALELIGIGEKPVDWILELLDPSTPHGAPTAPPEGLMLMDVGYSDLEWEEDRYTKQRVSRMLISEARRRAAMSGVIQEMLRRMRDTF
ncbi:MAG: tRNA pseudouridine(38-40) synthase TruA [Methanothrix sp.]|uniref:tRNA pseudouridine synthase A n=1 Tax=Methanothrix thermoacetophila (strain DSM 6194 / JCM 14653 / NBRC 101360 / PT) TaxID=349307 RepID=TRUA_METTP|nr:MULTISPECIES: tRNA pseudouridine(38-40) synthase TruA [Methanothrix]A0B7V0.1 RecName: Full=tRNA pseudouridine synthase A; AltName: Full=tRNA pseudouridine(38-40) synthase; AltName: Full=tRNA pseudouridylate synthase I; AltName: Full=tRNA-uridine isomerase I [Methanothrix thermoacetophila PT]ABK14774.1 tRNA pseudouridine synthase A [Methanothrix thermoacetophila PT]MBC7080394.1 tRNA pseudouridine(38-40) synthase TruA [Methanothrix sp.]NPU86939.1 tRNA pseudouridine(38-40) synthase TruA [Methan